MAFILLLANTLMVHLHLQVEELILKLDYSQSTNVTHQLMEELAVINVLSRYSQQEEGKLNVKRLEMDEEIKKKYNRQVI